MVWGILLLARVGLMGQAAFALRILPLDADSAHLAAEAGWPARTYTDSLALFAGLDTWINQLHEAAYLEASVDTLLRSSTGQYTALLHLGPAYTWLELQAGNAPSDWLQQAGYRARQYTHENLSFERWLSLRDRLARIAANHGYPFVRVSLKTLAWESPAALKASIQIDKGPLIRMEGIDLARNSPVGEAYLYAYLGFSEDEPYNEDKIRRVRARLRELPFVRMASDPQIIFAQQTARLQLELAPQPASRFDFVIGVLPNSAQTGRLLVTGQLEGEVLNAFGRGERLAARFEQPKAQTQELNLAVNYPYLLGLPFGVDLSFNLYRRDTNFLNLDWRTGLSYLLAGGDYCQVFVGSQTTSLLKIDSTALARRMSLPDTLDLSRSSFGLEYLKRQLDYRPSPRKGWSIWLRAAAGIRSIKVNTRIAAFGFEGLYDSLMLRTAQFRVEADLAAYWPLGGRGTLKLGMRGGSILSRAPILANERFRIGGSRLLRGFDEQSIFARHFGIATLEYRFLLSQNSYLYAFIDQAGVDIRSAASPEEALDFPRGFGTGITFETKAGLFGLSLAVGSRRDAPLDLGAPKVHLGYISLF